MAASKEEKAIWAQMTNHARFDPDDVWVTPKFLVEKYGKSKSYWYDLRKDGLGPEFLPMGHRSILYRLASVVEWMQSLAVTSLSDPKYRELRETRRLKHQERLKKKQAMIENRSLTSKTRGHGRSGPPRSWADVRLQNLRRPRFLVAKEAGEGRRPHPAGETARRIVEQFDGPGLSGSAGKVLFLKPITVASSCMGA